MSVKYTCSHPFGEACTCVRHLLNIVTSMSSTFNSSAGTPPRFTITIFHFFNDRFISSTVISCLIVASVYGTLFSVLSKHLQIIFIPLIHSYHLYIYLGFVFPSQFTNSFPSHLRFCSFYKLVNFLAFVFSNFTFGFAHRLLHFLF